MKGCKSAHNSSRHAASLGTSFLRSGSSPPDCIMLNFFIWIVTKQSVNANFVKKKRLFIHTSLCTNLKNYIEKLSL